jgi:predicted MPP superfamily phosphohydrolase
MSVLTRRRFVVAAGAVAAVVGLEAFVREPRALTVTRHRIGGGKRPLRLVQLTDLHLHGIHSFESDVAAMTSQLEPDLIVFTGDSIDRRDPLRFLDDFLALLPADTRKYAVLGNWDYWSGAAVDEIRRVYDRHGCRLLVNETVVHDDHGRRIRLTGVDDLVVGQPHVPQGHATDDTVAHVLLAHCPAYRDRIDYTAAAAFDCMISGHTHGGQIRFFGIAPVLPRGSGGYVSGWYRDAGRLPLHVSRGVGTTMIRARLGSPPEISLFEIVAE